MDHIQQIQAALAQRDMNALLLTDPVSCRYATGFLYHDGAALAYFERSIERERMHINTQMQLRYILTMLRDQGEKETFRYLKEEVLAGKPFPWEEKD